MKLCLHMDRQRIINQKSLRLFVVTKTVYHIFITICFFHRLFYSVFKSFKIIFISVCNFQWNCLFRTDFNVKSFMYVILSVNKAHTWLQVNVFFSNDKQTINKKSRKKYYSPTLKDLEINREVQFWYILKTK